MFFLGEQAIDGCRADGGKLSAEGIGNGILFVACKEGDIFADKDSKPLAAHAVKGCPYAPQCLVELLRILFLACTLFTLSWNADVQLQTCAAHHPLDGFAPPGEQVQGIFAVIPGKCRQFIKNTAFFQFGCRTIPHSGFCDNPMSFLHTEPHMLPPDHCLECTLG